MPDPYRSVEVLISLLRPRGARRRDLNFLHGMTTVTQAIPLGVVRQDAPGDSVCSLPWLCKSHDLCSLFKY